MEVVTSSHRHITNKHYAIMGSMLLAFSVILYGINICYARLTQLADIEKGNSFMEDLTYYFDPLLTVLGILTILVGIGLIVCSLCSRKISRSNI